MENTLPPALEFIASAMAEEGRATRLQLTDEQITQAAEFFDSSTNHQKNLLTRIFPHGISSDLNVYDTLYRMASLTGFGEAGAGIVGRLWAAVLLSLDKKEQQRFLINLPTGHRFFILLRSLPLLLARVQFDPEFLIQRFIELREQIANDRSQGGYWRGIEMWASSYPGDALRGLNVLLQHNLDDNGIAIGAAILGRLRVTWEQDKESMPASNVAEDLAQNPDITKRLVYHRSWINTGWVRGLSCDEFKNCIARMSAGTAEERSEAFNFLRCLVVDGRTEENSLEFGMTWLIREANSTLPENSKHWVANIVRNLGSRFAQNDSKLEILLQALLSVQPIPIENKGTWSEIEHFLVDLLHKNQPRFERWLLGLLEANPIGIIELFRRHGHFEYLCSEMMNHGAVYITAPLLFSIVDYLREFAFTVFDRLPFDSFPDRFLQDRSDSEIALCIFESRRHLLQPEHVARFFLAIRERAEQGSPQLTKLFRTELLYQAKNLPGAVLERLKTLTDKSPLLQEIVTEADAYFEKLGAAHRSAINSMEIPGWKRAAFKLSQQQSRDFETHQTDFDVFSKLLSTSYLIYGTEGFRYCIDGEMGEFSAMQKMSVTMELPRIAMIDPEGEVARNIEAGRMTEQLSQAIAKKKEAAQ